LSAIFLFTDGAMPFACCAPRIALAKPAGGAFGFADRKSPIINPFSPRATMPAAYPQ
jgi:hypothetical protein